MKTQTGPFSSDLLGQHLSLEELFVLWTHHLHLLLLLQAAQICCIIVVSRHATATWLRYHGGARARDVRGRWVGTRLLLKEKQTQVNYTTLLFWLLFVYIFLYMVKFVISPVSLKNNKTKEPSRNLFRQKRHFLLY